MIDFQHTPTLVGILVVSSILLISMIIRVHNDRAWDRRPVSPDKPETEEDNYTSSPRCHACNDTGYIETLGGYGNNPIEASHPCPYC